jgi:hypothetical protein
MAKKKETKKVELKEVSRVEINGNIIITYEDGSVKIIPAPIMLTADQASEIFGSEEDEDEEEEEESDDDEDEEESEDEEDEEESEDEEDEEDEDEDDSNEDEEDEEEEEEELTGEALAEMDFEELEDVCDDKDLDTDPDDFEEDIEKLRKAIAKELGIKLPAKKEAKGKGKKGKK